jgi:hypothetical protein
MTAKAHNGKDLHGQGQTTAKKVLVVRAWFISPIARDKDAMDGAPEGSGGAADCGDAEGFGGRVAVAAAAG